MEVIASVVDEKELGVWVSGPVLVTGASGFVGQNLVGSLECGGRKVLCPSRLEMDLLDGQSVVSYFQRHRPTTVVHLGAVVGGIGFNIEAGAALYESNVLMARHVMSGCASVGHSVYCIFLGSICAYPSVPAHIPFVEGDMLTGDPHVSNSPYGLAKRTIMSEFFSSGLQGIFLVPTNLYGACDKCAPSVSHVIPAVIRKLLVSAASGVPAVVWGDGTATRDFLDVSDLVGVMSEMVYRPVVCPFPVNVGTGVETSISSLVSLLRRHISCPEVVWDASKPNGQPRRVVCSERLRSLLRASGTRWHPTPFTVGCRRSLAYYQSACV